MSHDQKLVAHLRAALDEVAATPAAHAAPVVPLRQGLGARRWVAIAASVVIVAGAAVGIAMNRGDTTKVASPDATTTVPTASGPTMPYFLAAADLAPGEVSTIPATGADGLTMVWARNGDLADAFLVLQEVAAPVDGQPVVATATGASGRTLDGATLQFVSYGLTADEQRALSAHVVAGSGLPWILPVDGWTMMAMASYADGSTLQRQFGADVVMASGPMVIQLLGSLAPATRSVTHVQVAGVNGWQFETGGATAVVWQDPTTGTWVQLNIPASKADRVDALIAAVVPTAPTPLSVSGDALPALPDAEIDPAIGTPAPRVVGPGLDGNAVVIDPAATQHATLVVFVANFCPHCHAFLPNLQGWIADGTIPAGVDVVLVTTAESAALQSSAEWLAGIGWPTKVLVDASKGDGVAGVAATAYGATGWPFLVLVKADGTVAYRAAGELTAAGMTAILAHV